MNRTSTLLTLGVAAIIVLGFSPQAFAICSDSHPAGNVQTFIGGCPDGLPVAGYVAVVGAPITGTSAINNNGIDPICEDQNGTDGTGTQCTPDSGVAGDGIVTFHYDWANQAGGGTIQPAGCPTTTTSGVPGTAPYRNFFLLVCNNGAAAAFTVAFDQNSSGYPVDFALPFDGVNNPTVNVTAANNGLSLASFTRSAGQDTACIGQTAIPIYSDCDPGSLAGVSGLPCLDGGTTATPGANLFAFFGPATAPPTDLRTSHWTQQATTAGPSGSKCVQYPTPAAGQCAWIGSTQVVGGVDSGAVSNWVQVCAGDPTAATDKVKIDSAAFKQGTLHVDFSTESESLIVGFNVYAGSTKLNTGLIAAKGTGSNAYSFEVGRSAVKSNKTVTVEAVKSDSTVVKTAPVTLK